MNRFLKTIILSAAVAATALTALPANAGDWHHRHHRHGGGDALAAGVIGLAAGTILGSALAQPPRPVYRYETYPRTYYRTVPTYYQRPVYRTVPVHHYRSYEPWSPEWYRACDARYRSFDPGSGTFMGYDGKRHFCTLN